LYGAARIGDFIVTRFSRPTSSGWAIILVSAALLALGGCGRKGPLDLPPSATSPSAAAAADSETEAASKPSLFNPNYGADAPPTAPKGNKRPFVLDPLLGPDHPTPGQER
jgi:predicted small lipoprotein YifL